MGKGNRNRRKRQAERSRVHALVVVGGTDFEHAVDIIRPALLYADHVTVHAPVASMLTNLGGIGKLKSPVDQLAFIIAVLEEAPELAPSGFDLDEARNMLDFVRADRELVRRALHGKKGADEVEALYRQIDQMEPLFADKFGGAMEQAVEATGATELIAAIEDGLVTLAPLENVTTAQTLTYSAKAALDREADEVSDFSDNMVAQIMDALLDALSNDKAIPVFDETASGLARAMKTEGLIGDGSPEQREVTTASGLMAYLPGVVEAPLERVVEVRNDLRDPLIRFRGAVSRISHAFSSDFYDPHIEAEIRKAWRQDVEPELLTIREHLGEHGFLRSLQDVALEKPTALLTKSVGAPIALSGALAIGFAPVSDLSEAILRGLALGAPAADVAGKALVRARSGKRVARRNDFYFLHGVGEALG